MLLGSLSFLRPLLSISPSSAASLPLSLSLVSSLSPPENPLRRHPRSSLSRSPALSFSDASLPLALSSVLCALLSSDGDDDDDEDARRRLDSGSSSLYRSGGWVPTTAIWVRPEFLFYSSPD